MVDGRLETDPCTECGAVNCEKRFHRILALEYTDGRYGAVHHLTVPAYWLQHPSRLSREGWQAMRKTLGAFLVEGRSPQQQGALMRDQLEGRRRTGSLKKGERFSLPADFTWSMTIAAVDDANPDQYCEQIEAWARCVLTDANRL